MGSEKRDDDTYVEIKAEGETKKDSALLQILCDFLVLGARV
jgi:hypothetical protein